MGLGGRVKEKGEEVRGGDGREGAVWGGKGLLNFHLIYQKTWAEPGNPS